jgi:2-dehydropantoate 2-reductase
VPKEPISHLVVSTKAQDTLPALRKLYSRIDSKTSILLLQNGALAVQAKLVQDLETAGKSLPQFILGSTTHGVAKDTELNSHPSYRHTGLGQTFLGASSPLSHSSLLDQFSRLPPDFNIRIIHDYSELKKQLLIKVVVNSCLNCLSSLFLVRNGLLVETEHGRNLIHQLISESHSLLERDLEGVSKNELETNVIDVARKTAMNRNSMMVDVINGRDTEIDYFLGYLLDLARERNLSLPTHQFLYDLTLMKADLVEKHPKQSQIIE